MNFIEMELKEIQVNEKSGQQAIIIKEKNGERFLPIYIDIFVAEAIYMAIRNLKSQRPLTHELLVNAVQSSGATITKILIDDLKNNTYYGKVVIRKEDGKEVWIDSRPSDAIAIASRLKAPIFINEKILAF